MTRSLGVKAWATGALVLVAVATCASCSSDADPAPSATATTSTLGSTSPTSSPHSESEAASAAAEDIVRRYFVVLDSLRQDPAAPVKQLSSVATSTQLAAQRRLLTSERDQRLRQVGTTRVADLTVQSVNLDNSDPSVGKVPTVTVDVCWDVSRADLIDQGGKSVVSPDRANTGWTRYTVANYDWSENPSGGWRVATSRDLKRAPCASS
jgi:hypothetical protein